MAVSLTDFYFENGALVKFKGVRIEHMPVGHMRWLIRDMGALLHEATTLRPDEVFLPALYGPRTHICWTPDHDPNPEQVVLIKMSDWLRTNKELARRQAQIEMDEKTIQDLSKEVAELTPGRGMTRQQVDLVIKLIDMKIREYDARDLPGGGLSQLIIATETAAELRASAQEDE